MRKSYKIGDRVSVYVPHLYRIFGGVGRVVGVDTYRGKILSYDVSITDGKVGFNLKCLPKELRPPSYRKYHPREYYKLADEGTERRLRGDLHNAIYEKIGSEFPELDNTTKVSLATSIFSELMGE